MVGDDEEGLLDLVGLRYVTAIVASPNRETRGTTGVEVAAARRDEYRDTDGVYDRERTGDSKVTMNQSRRSRRWYRGHDHD